MQTGEACPHAAARIKSCKAILKNVSDDFQNHLRRFSKPCRRIKKSSETIQKTISDDLAMGVGQPPNEGRLTLVPEQHKDVG
jgi:hypothetical protein